MIPLNALGTVAAAVPGRRRNGLDVAAAVSGRRPSRRHPWIALAAITLALAPALFAQEPTGALYGIATDPQGGRLPGVTVTLTGIGAPQVQASDERGEIHFLRLDPGDYALRAELDGFSIVEHPRINIRIARSTTVEIVLTPQFEDVISVAAESPLLDLRKLERGVHVTRMELDAIPSARDPWALVAQAPGVLVDSVSVGGTRGVQGIFAAMGVTFEENDFLLDGIQITDMAAVGASATYFDFDQFEEVQLSTGGSDITKISAGVTLNLVTKRGSNDLRATARYFLTDEKFQSSPDVDRSDFPPGQASFIPTDRLDRLEDYGLEAGAPVRRDRVWFWGAAARNEIGKFATGGLPSETLIENLGFKANAQLSQSNSAVASWNWSSKEVLGRDVGPTRQKETGWNQDGDSTILKIEDTHLFGTATVLTGSYSDVDIEFELAGASGIGPGAPEALRNEKGVWTGNFLTFSTPRRSREAKLEGSYFFHGGELGHELKLGGRQRKWEDENILIWPGRDVFHASGVNFGFPDGPTDVLMAHRAGRNPTTEEFRSLWAQDTLSGARWTLNLGLRYDLQDGANDPSSVPANPAFPQVLPALDFAGNDGGGFQWETLSPRLGVTYALGEGGRTLLRASLARYPEALGSGDILHVNPMGEASAFFRFTDGNNNNRWDGPQEPTFFLFPVGFDPANPTALRSPNVTDPGLDPAVTDELVLGIEHALRPEFVLALHLTGRRTTDIQERRVFVRDVAGNVRLATREDYRQERVVTGTLPDGRSFAVPVFALRSGLRLTGGRLLMNGDREIEYRGIALSAVKRFSGRWMARGFFHYGDTEWSIPESFFAFNDPTDIHPSFDSDNDGQRALVTAGQFSDTFLDSRWQAHLSGLYQVAPERLWGFDFSANVYAREGYPLPYFVQVVSALDGIARRVQAVEDVDDFRTDDLVTVDLRLAKELPLFGDRLGVTLSADLFNALNEGTVARHELQLNLPRTDFVNETLSPRVWRLGVRISWD